MIINKKRFKKILIKRKDSHRRSQIKISAHKYILDRWVDRGTRQQYSILRLSRQFQAGLFFFYYFFLKKRFPAHKTRHKQKSANKTKTS